MFISTVHLGMKFFLLSSVFLQEYHTEEVIYCMGLQGVEKVALCMYQILILILSLLWLQKLMLQEINATQINENLISWTINFL